MSKWVTVNGKEIFNVRIENVNDPTHICKIHAQGYGKYVAYNDRGDGEEVVTLDSIAITELLATGEYRDNYAEIRVIG